MNLLILHWGAYTHSDIIETLSALHIRYHVINYQFKNKNHDDVFTHWFTKQLLSDSYDAVFTVNYFPLIAEVCSKHGMKYLSWCYDCPLNVYDIEDTLGYDTNYVFLFDRIQVEHYQSKGFLNVYHLPLAVNPTRLNAISLSANEYNYYSSEISFVGNLYQSTWPTLRHALSEYLQGYLDSIIENQLLIYGCYFIDSMLTNDLLQQINQSLTVTKEQLAYSLATFITHKERLLLLNTLSEKHELKLYCKENHPLLTKLTHQGNVSYIPDMYKVFLASDINLNITVKNTQSGIPLRALDILGSGGFLLSNYQPELVEYFTPDVHFIAYDSIEDALAKVAYYLHHKELCQQISLQGKQHCQELFNYSKQWKYLFKIADMET